MSKPYRPVELVKIAKLAQLDITPRGETERLAKELKRTHYAVQYQILQMRRSRSWRRWLESQNHDFARFRE